MSNQHVKSVCNLSSLRRTELQFEAGSYAMQVLLVGGFWTIAPFLFILLNSECLSKSFPLGPSKMSCHNRLLFCINKH